MSYIVLYWRSLVWQTSSDTKSTRMNSWRGLAVVSLVVCGAWQASAQQPLRGADFGARAAVRPLSRDSLLGTIQGNALTSTNGQVPNATVRLRNARFGGIIDSQLTDHSGLFSFKSVDPDRKSTRLNSSH